MAKQKSRPVRWAEAVGAATAARDKVTEAADDLVAALSDLNDIKAEYEEWRDTLPENLQQSALGEKLNEVCDLEFDSDDPLSDWETVSEAIDNADGIDLPLGFGRD
jgi:hypothetical protein